ncbi:MAG: hypothetical protein JO261_07505 [Alphaproteobacteria bacterium]|nr:hypothetical protein [Alphaproteobacteria bacterium]MBV9693528.1 hypothetical protein [Alphaproteobacteria bacterium]
MHTHLYTAAKAGLAIVGGIFELAGVFAMSARYINVDLLEVLPGLASALWRGQLARDIANLEQITREDVVTTLQGLSLIGLGFLFSTAANVLAAFD